jgi:hypothetical protein
VSPTLCTVASLHTKCIPPVQSPTMNSVSSNKEFAEPIESQDSARRGYGTPIERVSCEGNKIAAWPVVAHYKRRRVAHGMRGRVAFE